MLLGEVIGTIWATRKYEAVKGYKLQLLQPMNSNREKLGEPIIAVDTIGAGPHEIVFFITSSEAVIPMEVNMAPVDAAIVGIVDSINLEIKPEK